jgi:hypothetical protein
MCIIRVLRLLSRAYKALTTDSPLTSHLRMPPRPRN